MSELRAKQVQKVQFFPVFPAKDAFIGSGLFKEQALGSVRGSTWKSKYKQVDPYSTRVPQIKELADHS